MKSTRHLKQILIVTAFAAITICTSIFFSCGSNKKKITTINPGFYKYISAYTSGIISVKNTITVQLADVYKKGDKVPVNGDPAPEGIFSFDPAISGKAVWTDAQTIQFTPDRQLERGQLYDVKFELSKLMRVPAEFRNFSFQFATLQQNMNVVINEVRPMDDYNIEYMTAEVKITTADYADSAAMQQVLDVRAGDKKLKAVWKNDYYWDREQNRVFTFVIDSIPRQKKEQELSVQWNGEPLGFQRADKLTRIIPALGDFSVMECQVNNSGEQYVRLEFSEPIHPRQNLSGIVTVKGVDNLKYSVDGNSVYAYLPNRYVGFFDVTVTNGIKNFKGYKMIKSFSRTVELKEANPRVRLVGNGNILPNSNGLLFPFEAVMLKAVDVRILKVYEHNMHQFLQVNSLSGSSELYRVSKKLVEQKVDLGKDKKLNLKEWNRFQLDLAKYITPEPGAIYRVDIKFNKKYALCDCPEEESAEGEESGTAASLGEQNESWNEQDWYRDYDDGYYHYYYYDEENDENGEPCSSSYYYGKAVGRNILASDIGVIAKNGEDKSMNVVVSNMVNAQPIANATVEFYDFQKQLLGSAQTDGNGIVNYKLNKKPWILVAKHGKQRAYLKLADGMTNSLSKFDVGGEENKKGIKGFIYAERGVWRPGDSIYVNFILEDKLNALPAGHPVKFELLDPNYQVVQTVSKSRNVDGVFDFRTVTSEEAITGTWQARVSVGNRSFYKDLKIETVKPNRLKIYLEFPKEQLHAGDKDSFATLKVKWLHGAVAKNLAAQVDVSVSESETRFSGFNGYCFDSPLRSFHSDNITLFSGKVNEYGEAKINTSIKPGEAAPGMLKLNFSTKVWEEGGDFSVDRFTTKYSPFTHYVGVKLPEGSVYDRTLETGKPQWIDVASVSQDGKQVSRKNLNVKVYLLTQRWWYDQYESAANYLTRSGTVVILDTVVKTSNGKGGFFFRTGKHEYGKYLIVVTDNESKHSTGKVFWMDQPYWARQNRITNENASMLSFATDKEKYNVGETIKLTFPSPSEGKAFVSVETGRKILKQFWVDTKKGETTYEMQATPDMSPNAYLHVSLLQPHASTVNDLPIRLYGVVNVSVDDPATYLSPVIKMADIIKPESKTTVTVSEEKGKEMTYTLAIVDEGLLDLTRFRTPEPHEVFYTKEALGVKTWDLYDLVLGAQAGKIDKLLSIGGDEAGMLKKNAKANRFKPMVKFVGPFHLPAGASKAHTIDIPNYVGSVRVMVVASHDGAYGNSEKTVAVRKPLMVLATLPRVVGPSETVYLPVNVFALENHVKNVRVEVLSNDLFAIDGQAVQSMTFSKTGDEVINFKLKVSEKVGVGHVKIKVSSGKETAYQEIEIDVRTPNPKVVDSYESVIKPGEVWNKELAFKGINGANKGTVELSVLPPMSLESRMNYLIEYPHGCIEQTTSSVFPQMLAAQIVDLDSEQKKEITKNVKAGVRRLQLFQTYEGGFSYWPGESQTSEWGSNYAGHFIIEAEKTGYSLPSNMKQRWISYQQNTAKNWSNNASLYAHPHGSETNQSIQAYRLYTLALAGAPELGAMNRLREEKDLYATTRWRLAAAYQLVGQPEIAKQLTAGLKTDVPPYKELSYSYGSDVRDEAMILEALVIMKDWERAATLAAEVAKGLNGKEWYSTQETGYSLLAMCRYAQASTDSKTIDVDFSVNGKENAAKKTKSRIVSIKLDNDDIVSNKSVVSVKNNGTFKLYAKLITEGVPAIGDKTSAASNMEMTVHYTDMKGKEIDPSRLVQGTDFIAEVIVKNNGTKGNLKEMTLNQVFPGGWEIHNVRMDESYSTYAADKPRYQDVRDDRVYSYYNLNKGETKKFRIVLNATYMGRFYLPTVYTEAMYDNTINARIPGKWVEVVKDAVGVAGK